jgi:hypothetical protein
MDEHLSGRREHTLRLWQLLVFELWHRRYLDHREAPPHQAPVFRTEGTVVSLKRKTSTASLAVTTEN